MSAPILAITMSHPAIALTRGGVVYEKPSVQYDMLMKNLPDPAGTVNVISLMQVVYKFASMDINYVSLKAEGSYNAVLLRKRLSNDADDIGQAPENDGADGPCTLRESSRPAPGTTSRPAPSATPPTWWSIPSPCSTGSLRAAGRPRTTRRPAAADDIFSFTSCSCKN